MRAVGGAGWLAEVVFSAPLSSQLCMRAAVRSVVSTGWAVLVCSALDRSFMEERALGAGHEEGILCFAGIVSLKMSSPNKNETPVLLTQAWGQSVSAKADMNSSNTMKQSINSW